METNIIFGPPGTGKTTTLLKILEDELQTISPKEVAYVSFSRKGAYEGRDRALEKFSKYTKNDFTYFRTLHSIAFRELNIGRGMMIEKKHYKQFGGVLGYRFTGFISEDFHHSKDDAYLMYDVLRRNNPKYAVGMLDQLEAHQLRHIQLNYKRFREQMGIMDFTDLIERFVERNKALPVKVAIVDEAQDLTSLQWKMILVAFKECDRIYIAGDDDQALYQWSGADVEFFLKMKGSQRVLSKSYRLPYPIWHYSKQVTDLIGYRAPKDYTSNDAEGAVNVVSDIADINLDKGEWMIIGRNVTHLEKIMTYLRSKALMFTYKGKHSVMQSHISAINHYENIRRTGEIDKLYLLESVLDIDSKISYDKPWYDTFNLPEEIMTYYRDLLRDKVDIKKSRIEVNTIHGVKGGECENVIMLLDYSRNVKKNWDKDPDSELRCYYVGVTRSKKNLYLIPSQSRYGFPLLETNY